MKKSLILVSAMIFGASLMAQPQGGERPAPPKQPTPEEIAKSQADMMQAELGLTQKQYKKVYQLIKKDHQTRQSQSGSGNGVPPQGGPGMGGPGGGMGPGMGGPGGGMGPGMGGPGGGMGGPGGGMGPDGQGGPQGGMPPEFAPGGNQVTEEYLEKQEKKLQKILSPDQYSRWRKAHPAEHQQLPPVEFGKQ